MQHRIINSAPLLDAKGRLAEPGYATQPLPVFNPENLSLIARLRLKQWDYYGTTFDKGFFSLCISNIGYIGLVFAYFIDFETKECLSAEVITPLGQGCNMPRTSTEGDLHFSSGKVKMDFYRQPEKRRLTVDWKNFAKGMDLSGEVEITQAADHDGIVMVTPMDRGAFYYNHKINAMPTTGRFSLGARRFDLGEGNGLTCMDWGRGVWPYNSFWIWANASGRLPDGRLFGHNLGCGFGDLSRATENCFFIDGRIRKLGALKVDYYPADTMDTWRFTDDEDRLQLTLTPFFHRKSKVNLGILKTDVNQMFGTYQGRFTADDGEIIEIDNITGWAEDHHARW